MRSCALRQMCHKRCEPSRCGGGACTVPDRPDIAYGSAGWVRAHQMTFHSAIVLSALNAITSDSYQAW